MSNRIVVSLLIFMSLTNCASQKRKINFEKITYESMTRGRSEKITIKDDIVYYETHLKSNSLKLTEKQKKLIQKEISKINLKDISDLKAPTNKRLFDGAMHTTISIKKESTEYSSTTFDDTNPPAELIGLCTLLKSFSKE